MKPRSLRVESVRGPLFVQDGGRPGAMHHAVPEGGALVPEALAASNVAVGNAWSAAALEIFGSVTLRAENSPIDIALDGERHALAADETITIEPSRATRVRYLAIAGGIDVPQQLGGRGTLLTGAIGGLDGRALRRGDRLAALAPQRAGAPHERLASFDRVDAIRVVAGPDLARFAPHALEHFADATYVLSAASDRVGTRLEGASVPRLDADDGGSRPMVRGAIEVPSGGAPVVLGPDHPTTGGYSVLAVVIRADHGAFGARRPGDAVRFTCVSVSEARTLWREHAARWFDQTTLSAAL